MSAERAVQTVRESPVADAEAMSVKDAIIRAANNPNIDPERLERFLAMFERLAGREAEQAYDDAMNAAQEDMRPVAKDLDNPQTKSRYASFAALDRAVRPIYAKHGFSLSFSAGDGAPAEYVRIICRVSHRAGHKEFPHIDMPADGKGAKGGDVMTKTHATGAAFTYGQRYLLKAIFNIAVGDDDDRGGSGSPRTSTAVEAANAAINACKTLEDLKAWKAKNAANVQSMHPDDADAIIRSCNDRASRLRGDQ